MVAEHSSKRGLELRSLDGRLTPFFGVGLVSLQLTMLILSQLRVFCAVYSRFISLTSQKIRFSKGEKTMKSTNKCMYKLTRFDQLQSFHTLTLRRVTTQHYHG